MSAPRILIVDDEPGMLRTVERILAPHYPVATARTPDEARAHMSEFQPELAILDIRMPEMDGFALMRVLREAHADLDVIFMTGVVHELDLAGREVRGVAPLRPRCDLVADAHIGERAPHHHLVVAPP